MKIFKHSILAVFVLTLLGCNREDVTFAGERAGVASDNFQVTTPFAANTSTVNFSAGNTVTFSATFNEEVSYTITITGQTSGAVKTITGMGSQLNEVWTGNADLIFFTAENVTAELTVLGQTETYGQVNIGATTTYNPEGVQLANFESGGTTASCWFPSGNQIACQTNYSVSPSLEGSSATRVAGVSVDKPGDQFVGLSAIEPRSGVNNNGSYFSVPTTDPDDLYFTVFIYGSGDENVAMFIKFMQDESGNGAHEGASENGFEWQLLDLSHTGWKKFSIKYSDVPLGGNTNFGGNGDGIYRPDQIVKIEFGLWAMDDPDTAVEFIYDYAVFTAGKPFGE